MDLINENRQAPYDFAGQLMRQGQSNKQVQGQLQAKGLTAQQAAILTHQMRSQFREGCSPQNRLLTFWQQLYRRPLKRRTSAF